MRGEFGYITNMLLTRVYDENVTLIISLDRSKTLDIKTYSDEFEWKHGEKKVILQECNLGLRKHVLSLNILLMSDNFHLSFIPIKILFLFFQI